MTPRQATTRFTKSEVQGVSLYLSQNSVLSPPGLEVKENLTAALRGIGLPSAWGAGSVRRGVYTRWERLERQSNLEASQQHRSAQRSCSNSIFCSMELQKQLVYLKLKGIRDKHFLSAKIAIAHGSMQLLLPAVLHDVCNERCSVFCRQQ
eukprot:363096-Chlamydomonas_euryale.AAC.8